MDDPLDPAFLTTLGLMIAVIAAWIGYVIGRRERAQDATAPQSFTSESSVQLRDSLLDLDTVSVDDIMIPRSEIASIDLNDDWDEILDTLRTTPHTRLPVCRDNLDNILGILHMKKVAHALARGDFTRERLAEIASEREAYFTPEGTSLSAQLLNFRRDRRRIALVVDEYGDIQGLVTLEDILEEIVGEFTNAPAALHKDIHREADGSYVLNGSVSLRVLNRTLGWALPTHGPRTLNGVILEQLERIPQPGEVLQLSELEVEVLQTTENGVRTVRARTIAPALTSEGAA